MLCCDFCELSPMLQVRNVSRSIARRNSVSLLNVVTFHGPINVLFCILHPRPIILVVITLSPLPTTALP